MCTTQCAQNLILQSIPPVTHTEALQLLQLEHIVAPVQQTVRAGGHSSEDRALVVVFQARGPVFDSQWLPAAALFSPHAKFSLLYERNLFLAAKKLLAILAILFLLYSLR